MSAPSAKYTSHARTFGLLVLLLTGTSWLSWVVCTNLHTGATSELLLLMFECVLILIDSSQTLLRYVIYIFETWRQSRLDSAETDATQVLQHPESLKSSHRQYLPSFALLFLFSPDRQFPSLPLSLVVLRRLLSGASSVLSAAAFCCSRVTRTGCTLRASGRGRWCTTRSSPLTFSPCP